MPVAAFLHASVRAFATSDVRTSATRREAQAEAAAASQEKPGSPEKPARPSATQPDGCPATARRRDGVCLRVGVHSTKGATAGLTARLRKRAAAPFDRFIVHRDATACKARLRRARGVGCARGAPSRRPLGKNGKPLSLLERLQMRERLGSEGSRAFLGAPASEAKASPAEGPQLCSRVRKAERDRRVVKGLGSAFGSSCVSVYPLWQGS